MDREEMKKILAEAEIVKIENMRDFLKRKALSEPAAPPARSPHPFSPKGMGSGTPWKSTKIISPSTSICH